MFDIAEARLRNTSASITQLQAALDVSVSILENLLDRKLVKKTYTEYFYDERGHTISLAAYPIDRVAGVFTGSTELKIVDSEKGLVHYVSSNYYGHEV
jgi:hypothetical protein